MCYIEYMANSILYMSKIKFVLSWIRNFKSLFVRADKHTTVPTYTHHREINTLWLIDYTRDRSFEIKMVPVVWRGYHLKGFHGDDITDIPLNSYLDVHWILDFK